MPKISNPAASVTSGGTEHTSPITFGTYYQDALPDGSQVTATLLADPAEPLVGGFYGLELNIPQKPGATRASLTVLFFNGDDAIYGMQTAGPFEDVPLGQTISLEDNLQAMQANNSTYDANPVTGRVTIDSVYWYDDDWNLVQQFEGLDFWGWVASA